MTRLSKTAYVSLVAVAVCATAQLGCLGSASEGHSKDDGLLYFGRVATYLKSNGSVEGSLSKNSQSVFFVLPINVKPTNAAIIAISDDFRPELTVFIGQRQVSIVGTRCDNSKGEAQDCDGPYTEHTVYLETPGTGEYRNIPLPPMEVFVRVTSRDPGGVGNFRVRLNGGGCTRYETPYDDIECPPAGSRRHGIRLPNLLPGQKEESSLDDGRPMRYYLHQFQNETSIQAQSEVFETKVDVADPSDFDDSSLCDTCMDANGDVLGCAEVSPNGNPNSLIIRVRGADKNARGGFSLQATEQASCE